MITVGVSGTIGSGKSTLCREWETLGARVIYADPLARELMINHPELKQKIVNAFGEQSYFPDGSLNRSFLAKAAFDGKRADELNQLVHPVVRAEIESMMRKARSEGVPMFVEEAALLLLNGRPEGFETIVVVAAPEKERIRRTMDRDGLSSDQVRARLSRQQSQEEMMQLADHVIWNDQTVKEFKQKCHRLYEELINR